MNDYWKEVTQLFTNQALSYIWMVEHIFPSLYKVFHVMPQGDWGITPGNTIHRLSCAFIII